MGEEWTLKMAFNDIEYDVKGNEKKISEHLYLIMDQLKGIKEQENRSIHLNLKVNRDASRGIHDILSNKTDMIEVNEELQTFVETLGTRIEWIYCLGIACYIMNNEENHFLTAGMLRETYTMAGIRQPQNIHLAINQCVRKGYMKEVGKVQGLKAFIVQQKGFHFIDRQVNRDHEKEDNQLFEGKEQKLALEQFMHSLTSDDYKCLGQFETMEERILLLMYLLKLKGFDTKVRPNFIYLLMREVFGYNGLPRSVHLGVSRTRPLTRKLKIYNKIHYQIEDRGIDWIKENIEKLKN